MLLRNFVVPEIHFCKSSTPLYLISRLPAFVRQISLPISYHHLSHWAHHIMCLEKCLYSMYMCGILQCRCRCNVLWCVGLDSFAALNVMHYLSQLAKMGHTVIASIHQPRPIIFDSFHKVVILSEGYQLYLGPPSGCVNWFQQHIKIPYVAARDGNVPDWVMDSVSVTFAKPLAVAQR